MRTFEMVLWTVTAAWALAAAWWHLPRRALVSGAAAMLVAVALQLAIEGARFHMLPTYGLAAGLVLVSGTRWRSRRETGVSAWRRAARGVPVAALTAIAAALPLLFPVFTYEQPGGPYAIGTTEYELNDVSRQRDLVVQAWYPIDAGASGAPIGITSRPELLAAAYSSVTGLPTVFFDNLRLVRTHATHDAPVARGQRFPVVLFSHGPGSANRSQSILTNRVSPPASRRTGSRTSPTRP